ncbi:MAG TPA: serine hydrolase [Candidatus Paceibacterota bacterium]
MRQINKQNLNNFLFAALVLVLVLIGKTDPTEPTHSYRQTLEQTSVKAASEQTSAYLVAPETRTAAVNAQFSPETSILGPYTSMPELSLQAAYIKDLTTGRELFNTSDHNRWPIASLTKLMTAVIAREHFQPETKILITEKAFQTEGAAGNLNAGELYTVSDLIQAMLMVSSNDAAAALAEFYGTTKFIEVMQKKAATLNMFQTTFFDETGLSFINQSSVQDLEKLLTHIRAQHPDLLEISRTRAITLKELSTGRKNVLTNINYFATWPDFRGGKTGFIDSSGGNLLSTFEHKNHIILIIVLGAEDRFEQTERLYNWIKTAFIFN